MSATILPFRKKATDHSADTPRPTHGVVCIRFPLNEKENDDYPRNYPWPDYRPAA